MTCTGGVCEPAVAVQHCQRTGTAGGCFARMGGEKYIKSVQQKGEVEEGGSTEQGGGLNCQRTGTARGCFACMGGEKYIESV